MPKREEKPSARSCISSYCGGCAGCANVCERRVMEQEKVPVADKIISLSDADASFIVKGGWNTVVGYRPQLARSGAGLCHGACVTSGQRGRQPAPCSFRTTRDGTSSGLTRSIIVSPEIVKQSRTVPSPGPQRTTAPS